MSHPKIAIYITGGIASYKVTQLVRLFKKNNAEVRVAMTKNAQKFITPVTLATLSQNEVLTDLTTAFEQGKFIPHIELAKWADKSIIVPATANMIGKLANGIADDLVSSALLATPNSKYLVPAMNDEMWDNPATQRNINTLKHDGYHILEPATGFLAEGYNAKGRMPEPLEIYQWITQNKVSENQLKGKKILVTAGGTQESIDPVRYIGNRSSGKMGIQIAKKARDMGAQVTLIVGTTTQKIPAGINVIQIRTFNELQTQLMAEFKLNDILIMAAAVSDYHVEHVQTEKIKAQDNDEVTLKLVRNPNLLKMLSETKHRQLIIGFAAETEHLLQNAEKELADKKIDMIVANDVSRKDIGFGSDENEVYFILPAKKPKKIAKASKAKIASEILIEVVNLLKKEED